LHAGSLVAALASWLDARAHGGRWLVRIEDVDTPRCIAGVDEIILKQLASLGLVPDEPPVWQSQRTVLYQQALDQLIFQGQAYPCNCSRKTIETVLNRSGQPRGRNTALIYPGTCKSVVRHPADLYRGEQPAWRLNISKLQPHLSKTYTDKGKAAPEKGASQVPAHTISWNDRRLGPQTQDVERDVGDFVLHRADGCFAYQLAVVVDDAALGITHVVRGEDLADNTARQILLQRALGYPLPAYLHTPLVLGANGEKLSKQNGAQALDTSNPLVALQAAGHVLGIRVVSNHVADWLAAASSAWADRVRAQQR
jgi:glutamyl-Q tRNA(Asp) synthetase